MKKIYIAIVGLLLLHINNSIQAQDSIKKIDMDEVLVSAFRFPENNLKIPFTIKKISNKGWNMHAPSMAEVLSNSGAVFVQKSQAGGGSPVIRGFEASRVLLMIDGVRMNNAIYRTGHLQNAITVDANILNHVDILYGPASTQFGSDALGGVVSMFTKKAVLSTSDKTDLHGTVISRYSSAINAFQLHADINIGGKKWAYLTSLTSSNYGDVVQGDKRNNKYPDFGKKNFYVNTVSGTDFVIVNNNPNKQVASGYKQVDLLQKIKYVPTEGEEHELNIQYSNTSDVPRYDRLTEFAGTLPRFGEWYYGPQKRVFLSYKFSKDLKKGYFNKLQSIAAYQDIEESRLDRRLNNKNLNNRIENIKVFSYTLDGLHKKGKNESHIGIEIQNNNLKSIAFSENIVTGTRTNNINTRYPDGKNRMHYIAAYYQNITQLNPQTTLSGGVRYTQANLSSTFVDLTIMKFPFDAVKQSNGAFSGNLGITYNTKANWKFSGLLSTGFRAANFDDLGKVFDSRAGSVVVPNANLKPEYAYNGEINATKYAGSIELGAAAFYTILRNAIVVDAFTFNGQSKILYQGVNSNVLASQNKNKAFIYGGSFFTKITIANATTIEGTVSYTYGRVRDTVKIPLDHIPPFFGKLGVKHTKKIWNAELFTLFNGAKKLKDYSSSGEDNLQYATVDGMPSWYTINLRTQINVYKSMSILAGVENILDTNYRVFASGISAPGRNYVLSVKASF
jgi:hemoglobin/transferrin/lactoferrin receptor protein